MNINDVKKNILKSKDLYIYTHLDIDGLTSAAIFIRWLFRNEFKGGVNVSITQPFYLKKDLDLSIGYDTIVIMDLGINEKVFKKLKGLNYYVFDHHKKTIPYMNDRIFLDMKRSASMIIYSLFGGDKFDKYLSMLGGAADKIIYNVELGKRSVIISSAMKYNMSNKWFVYNVLGMMIDGKDPYKDNSIKYYAKMMKQLLDVLKFSYVDLSEKYDNIIVRYYSKGYGFASALADVLVKELNKPVFIIVDIPYKDQILITARSNNNIGIRDVIMEIGRNSSKAGGHEYAASCIIDSKRYERMFDILSMFDKKVKESVVDSKTC